MTPQQYGQGYFEKRGFLAFQRRWTLIRRLPDGNYLVREPEVPRG